MQSCDCIDIRHTQCHPPLCQQNIRREALEFRHMYISVSTSTKRAEVCQHKHDTNTTASAEHEVQQRCQPKQGNAQLYQPKQGHAQLYQHKQGHAQLYQPKQGHAQLYQHKHETRDRHVCASTNKRHAQLRQQRRGALACERLWSLTRCVRGSPLQVLVSAASWRPAGHEQANEPFRFSQKYWQ